MQYVKDIEPEAFDDAVRKHKGPVIVEVYQPGCPACRALLYRLRAVGLLTRQHMPEVKVVSIVRTVEDFHDSERSGYILCPLMVTGWYQSGDSRRN